MNTEEKPATTPRLNFGNPAASAAPASAPVAEPVAEEQVATEVVTPAVEQASDGTEGVIAPEPEAPNEEVDVAVEAAPTEQVDEVVDPAPEITEVETVIESQVRSVEELEAEKAALDAQIEAQKTAQKSAVIDQIKTVVGVYGITTEELVEALGGLKMKRKGVKAKPKYRDPATGVTWSGRGKAPLWIRDKDYTKFLIPAEESSVAAAV